MADYYDAFISYGRADSKDFATQLHARLTEKGLNVWFDQNDIPLAVDFQEQINDGIARCHNFLFIIAPHAVHSPYCTKEIELATKYNKRIINLLHVEEISQVTWQQRHPQATEIDWKNFQTQGLHLSLPHLHPLIEKINWAKFQENVDDFEQSFQGLLDSIHKNEDYVDPHTDILVQALKWEKNQRQTNYLLIGEDREKAKTWLSHRFQDEQPPCLPTDLHCEFICESIKNADNLMTQVFLAAAESDRDIKEKIGKTLMREGFTIWTNQTDIKTGVAFSEEINQGIEGADNFIYLISPDALQSKYCQQELERAFSQNKRIIPLLIEATDTSQISTQLDQLQFIDFREHRESEQYHQKADKLLKELKEDAFYHENHKILLVKALKWKRQNYNPSLLLRGYNLQHFKTWLQVAKQQVAKQPPLPIQEEFITASDDKPQEASLAVFISYSRADADFARQLNDSLQQLGKTTWFDQESIASGEDFKQEICRGIENSDNFLFIISPRSIYSRYCSDEVEYALKLNKRLVTVLYNEVSEKDLHPALAKVQWIDFKQHSGDFGSNFNELVRTLDTDTEQVRNHTKWLQRALGWQTSHQNTDLLLRGSEFAIAQAWLKKAEQEHKHPTPTDLQKEFITKSSKAIEAQKKRDKRQVLILRSLLAGVSVSLLAVLGVGTVAWGQYQKERNLLEDQINSQSRYANLLTDSNREFNALLEGLRAGQLKNQLGKIKPETQSQVIKALRRAVQGVRERNQIDEHDGKITSASLSPDGKIVATASDDKTVKLWTLKGEEIGKLQLQSPVKEVIFSPDSSKIATNTEDNTVKLWNLQGKLLITLQHKQSVQGMQFSPDSQLLISYGIDKTAQLWNLEQKVRKQLEHKADVYGVGFSPDQKIIATRSKDSTVKLWNREGKLLKILNHDPKVGEVYGMDFSRDGKTIATASKDKTAKLWKLDGKELYVLPHTDFVNGVLFSPDRKRLVTYSRDATAKLWSLEGKELATLKHNNEVYGVEFSPDGRKIVTYSRDATAKIWSLEGKELATLQHSDRVLGVEFSPDSQIIATRSQDGTVKLWSLAGELLKILWTPNPVNYMSFTPDNQTIVTYSQDSPVQIWSRNSPYFQTFLGHEDWITDVSFSLDGKTIATASKDRTAKLWNLEGKVLPPLMEHNNEIRRIKLSNNGQFIGTNSNNDWQVKLWNQDGKLLRTFEQQYSFMFSPDNPDNKLIALASGKTVQLWNLEDIVQRKAQSPLDFHAYNKEDIISDYGFSPNGQLMAIASGNTLQLWDVNGKKHAILSGHKEPIKFFKFSPTEDTIATASKDKTVKLWDLQGKELYTLTGHNSAVKRVEFSRDGQTIATLSEDNRVKLWNLQGEEVHTLNHDDQKITFLSFSPDGKIIATASADHTVKLWNLAGEELETLLHNSEVSRLSFSPDGRKLATVSQQKALTVWNIDAQKLEKMGSQAVYLDSLREGACHWVKDYLQYAQAVKESDRHLCDGESIQKTLD